MAGLAMTPDDIIRMAREAGFNTNHEMIWIKNWEISPYMARFAALVAAAEREACAKVADKYMERWTADAIRARGQQ